MDPGLHLAGPWPGKTLVRELRVIWTWQWRCAAPGSALNMVALSTLDGWVNGSGSCGVPELRTGTLFLEVGGDIPIGQCFRPAPRGICPWAHITVPKSLPKGFTCWQRAGDPGGWLAQALVA